MMPAVCRSCQTEFMRAENLYVPAGGATGIPGIGPVEAEPEGEAPGFICVTAAGVAEAPGASDAAGLFVRTELGTGLAVGAAVGPVMTASIGAEAVMGFMAAGGVAPGTGVPAHWYVGSEAGAGTCAYILLFQCRGCNQSCISIGVVAQSTMAHPKEEY